MNAPEILPNSSVWSELGSSPDLNELEVTIMGSGFGESIVVYVGGGFWFVVDSCKDQTDESSGGMPAPLRYLRAIGVNVDSDVSIIVATHWDSDHIGRIGDLVDACSKATFVCANALVRREFLQYKERLMTGSVATDGAQLKEFSKVLDICRNRGPVKYACTGCELKVWPKTIWPFKKTCTLRSLSPSDKKFDLFLSEILGEMPNPRESKRAAALRTPNLASVVLHIDWEGTSVLLGADMETHPDLGRGCSSAI